MSKVDLHVHTTASDGILTPEQVVRAAADRNVSVLSITDHDTFSGYLQAEDAAKETGIQLIPGIEITCDYKGSECHILTYGFDTENEALNAMLSGQRLIRVSRARKMVSNLNKLGFDLDFEDVLAEAGDEVLSRVHIAGVLVKKTYTGDIREAFARYLGEDAPAYHKSKYPTVKEIIQLVRNAGGVTVLAHPANHYLYEDLRYFLQSGLDGLEYRHPSHNYELEKKYRDYAENHDLLLTGGSDFHGFRKTDFDNLGTICVDIKLSDKLLTLSEQRKADSTIS